MKKLTILLFLLIIFSAIGVFAEDLVTNEDIISDLPKNEYVKDYGKVEKIEKNLVIVKQELQDEEEKTQKGEAHLIVNEHTRIFNIKGDQLKISDLKGKNIYFYNKGDRVQTTIYPPKFFVDIIIVYEEGDEISLEFGRINKIEDRYYIEDRLILNTLVDTKIKSENNKVLEAKDINGKLALIKYDKATFSIPPQTTALEIIILEKHPEILDELSAGVMVNIIDSELLIKDGKTYLPLRKTLERENYKISWNKESKNIIIEKADEKFTIDTINKKLVEENRALDTFIENGITYIKL